MACCFATFLPFERSFDPKFDLAKKQLSQHPFLPNIKHDKATPVDDFTMSADRESSSSSSSTTYVHRLGGLCKGHSCSIPFHKAQVLTTSHAATRHQAVSGV